MENSCYVSLKSTISRRACLGGLAVAGLIAGHCLAYRYFGPADPHAHHHGHSHTPYIVAALVGLLVAALGSFIDSRSNGKRGVTALSVLALQITGFLGLSSIDSLTAGTGTELGSRAFWAGLVLQIVVAGLGVIVLTAFRKTVRVIARLLRGELAPSPLLAPKEVKPPIEVALPSLAMAAGGPTFRGPPLTH